MRNLIIILSLLFVCCTSNNDFEKGKRQLEQQGYTDVINTGYEAFCCGDKDMYSTGFECKDKNGNLVRGCFCSNVFKGLTIRFQ